MGRLFFYIAQYFLLYKILIVSMLKKLYDLYSFFYSVIQIS